VVVMSCCGGGTVRLLLLTSHAVITHVYACVNAYACMRVGGGPWW